MQQNHLQAREKGEITMLHPVEKNIIDPARYIP
jgi:hypothetical protein